MLKITEAQTWVTALEALPHQKSIYFIAPIWSGVKIPELTPTANGIGFSGGGEKVKLFPKIWISSKKFEKFNF